MCRRVFLLVALAFTAAGCSDRVGPTASTTATATAAAHATTARSAREHLARVLALALADPGTRARVKRRLDASNAPEGKVQFQALVHADQSALLATLARAGATSSADLLADLDAARGLELYLPVATQRASWVGDANYLVGTIGSDREIPVGFDWRGSEVRLDPRVPPNVPVLALVPQETDFAPGHPDRIMACVDMCGDPTGGGGTFTQQGPASAPGLYLVQSHFDDYHESWLKGQPEFEYHIYGMGDNGTSVQLACTGEHSGGGYTWDQNALDWTGAVLLLSDVD
ncbi:MAG: hypothetical protein ACRELE_10580, partial [Gemmatimonadales bacterium]